MFMKKGIKIITPGISLLNKVAFSMRMTRLTTSASNIPLSFESSLNFRRLQAIDLIR
jgi:hypothetical protein